MYLVDQPFIPLIAIEVENTNDINREVTLFYSHMNYISANYGNKAGITIIGAEEMPYVEYLSILQSREFITGRVDIITSNEKQAITPIDFVAHKYDGSRNLETLMPSVNKKGTRSLSVFDDPIINGSMEVCFEIEPHTKVKLEFHHKEIKLSWWRRILAKLLYRIVKR